MVPQTSVIRLCQRVNSNQEDLRAPSFRQNDLCVLCNLKTKAEKEITLKKISKSTLKLNLKI